MISNVTHDGYELNYSWMEDCDYNGCYYSNVTVLKCCGRWWVFHYELGEAHTHRIATLAEVKEAIELIKEEDYLLKEERRGHDPLCSLGEFSGDIGLTGYFEADLEDLQNRGVTL